MRLIDLVVVACLLPSLSAISYAGDFNYHRDFAQILAATQDSLNGLYYPRLITRFRANDGSLTSQEVLALLIGFTANPVYHPYDELDTERYIYSLNGKQQYAQAIALADSFLESHPVNQMTLIEKAYAYHKLEKVDSADFYGKQFKRIMEAMQYSGEATSAKDAAFALGPADGQNFVNKFMGYRIQKMGSGSDSNKYFLDIIWGIPKDTEEPVAFYFNIDHAMTDFRAQLKKASGK